MPITKLFLSAAIVFCTATITQAAAAEKMARQRSLGPVETTGFPGERHIAFMATVVDQDCKVDWIFNTRTSGTPSHGSIKTGDVIEIPNPRMGCTGNISVGIATYKWNESDDARIDQFDIEVLYPPTQDNDPKSGVWYPVSLKIYRGSIELIKFDLASGQATIRANAAADTIGTAAMKLTEQSGRELELKETLIHGQGAEIISIPIDRPSIPRGLYNKLSITWKSKTLRKEESGVEWTAHDLFHSPPPKDYRVLGSIRYTRYNAPHESECNGAPVIRWVVESIDNCQLFQDQFKADFVEEVLENGTGLSMTRGYIKPARATALSKSCKNNFPDGANLDNTVVMVGRITGACNTVLTPDTSVAEFSTRSSRPECEAKLLLVKKNDNSSFGARDIDDRCPACDRGFGGQDGHMDNFSDFHSCNGKSAVDLGNFWTYKKP